jgi:hypothetical protein
MIDDDAFEALKAGQIYTFAALQSAQRLADVARGVNGLLPSERTTAERLLRIVENHLYQIDAVVERENKERS